jgi:tetratricopeptide (TPR) repeat protein
MRAEVAVRKAELLFSGGDLPGAAAAAQTAIGLAQAAQEVRLEAEGHIWWGQALDDLGDYEEARVQFVQALTLSRAAGLRQEEAFSLTRLGVVSAYQNELEASKAYYEQASCVYREIGDRYGEAVNIPMRAVLLYEGDVDQARALTEEHLQLWREIGRRSGEGWALLTLGRICRLLGDYDRGRCYYEQGLHILRDVGWSRGEGAALNELGLLSHLQGDDKGAAEHCQQALLVGQGSADRWVQAYALTFLGHALASLGRLDEATSVYNEALALRRQLREDHRANGALAGLARVSLAQGDLRGAQAHVDKILSYLETDALVPSYEPFRVYLTCYRVLQASGDPRDEEILDEAHSLLQERAAKISDEGERRSYLENVAANREAVGEYVRRQEEAVASQRD